MMKKMFHAMMLTSAFALAAVCPCLAQEADVQEPVQYHGDTEVECEDGTMTIRIEATENDDPDFWWEFDRDLEESTGLVDVITDSTQEEGLAYAGSFMAAGDGEDTIRLLYTDGFVVDMYMDFTVKVEDGKILETTGGETLTFVKADGEPEDSTEEIAEMVAISDVMLSDDASDFVLLSDVVPDAILEIRYYSTYNFVGDRIEGYEQPVALLTSEAAQALKEVSDDLVEQGYRLKIFDAYRPQMAVTNFMEWAEDLEDVRMKEYFYPELDKSVLFEQGYIAEHSGHSRGSTVDLTLFDMETEKEVDMGGTFDYFGELSHPDYTGITEEQYNNRMILRDAMTAHGFRPLEEEWWHFTLDDEPYPDTYFTFPVSEDSVA